MKSLDEILIEKGVDAVKEIVVDHAGKVFGPAAEELGFYFADKIYYRRQKNLLKFLQEYIALVERLKLAQQEPRLNLLHPILEKASLQEDAFLRSKWAALLANAADPNSDMTVRPAFAQILGELTAPEARVLDSLYPTPTFTEKMVHVDGLDLMPIFAECGVEVGEQPLILQALSRHGLFRMTENQRTYLHARGKLSGPIGERNPFGHGFVAACRVPSKRVTQET